MYHKQIELCCYCLAPAMVSLIGMVSTRGYLLTGLVWHARAELLLHSRLDILATTGGCLPA
ncbi:hypothetical protein T02_14967 [Trichinella nativa]|uniref:Uncharacterized protein n=3 Tax=Trichinella TaxID=6333 RepID=A0A0V1L3A0_9BILA|nr:hypothetical protein T02_14967 [Trichinella nativa]